MRLKYPLPLQYCLLNRVPSQTAYARHVGKAVLNTAKWGYDIDMRSRVPLFLCLLAISSLALPFVAHAGIPFFGPIIDKSWVVQGTNTQCALGWGAVITVINNIISLLLTLAIVFVAPIMIAYAGFLYVVNPMDPTGIGKARGILLNTIIGIVIALAGWLIVAAIMAVLYKPDASTGWTTTWSQLITSNSGIPCIEQSGVGTGLNQAATPSVSAGVGATTALSTNGNCAPSNLLQATAGSAYALTQSQANTLSCIAVPESSCGTNMTGATTVNGAQTSAAGMFQIIMGFNDTCHNLNIPSCTEAAQRAGYNMSGNLNCSNAFNGGKVKSGMESLAAACRAAAMNLNCNAQAAACLIKQNNGYSAWTADPRSTAQKSCIAKYANT